MLHIHNEPTTDQHLSEWWGFCKKKYEKHGLERCKANIIRYTVAKLASNLDIDLGITVVNEGTPWELLLVVVLVS